MVSRNKHYITVQDIFIIKGFSDAFEQPTDTDICINEYAQRHFELNNKTNPQLKDDDGFALYKYVDGEVLSATQEEQSQYAQVQLDKLRAERDSRLIKLDSYQGVLRYNALSSAQQTELAEYRQALLDAPSVGVLPEVLAWL